MPGVRKDRAGEYPASSFGGEQQSFPATLFDTSRSVRVKGLRKVRQPLLKRAGWKTCRERGERETSKEGDVFIMKDVSLVKFSQTRQSRHDSIIKGLID
jgi:hypothetical protein